MTTHELARKLLDGPDETVLAAYLDNEARGIRLTGLEETVHHGLASREGDFWEGNATILSLSFHSIEKEMAEFLATAEPHAPEAYAGRLMGCIPCAFFHRENGEIDSSLHCDSDEEAKALVATINCNFATSGIRPQPRY